MILGIGTDIVAVKRFEPWTLYLESRLLRVFTMSEIADCRDAHGRLIAEKLAVRFATKEAFYKALSSALIKKKIVFKPFTLLAVCPFVEVAYEAYGVPFLRVSPHQSFIDDGLLEMITVHLSLAHEDHIAVATVLLEQL